MEQIKKIKIFKNAINESDERKFKVKKWKEIFEDLEKHDININNECFKNLRDNGCYQIK